MWKYYALLSAFFAALTAIFAKIGVKDINSDLPQLSVLQSFYASHGELFSAAGKPQASGR